MSLYSRHSEITVLSDFTQTTEPERTRKFLLCALRSRVLYYIDMCENMKTYMLSLKQIAIYEMFKTIDWNVDLDLFLLRNTLCSADTRGGFCLDLIKILVRLLFEDVCLEFDFDHDTCSMHCDGAACEFSFHLIGKLEDEKYIHMWVCNDCSKISASASFIYADLIDFLSVKNKEIFNDLLKCGDVEANPGPVMSKFAISELGFRYEAQSLFDHNHTVKHEVSLDDSMMLFVNNLTSNVSNQISNAQCYLSTACKLFLILNNLDNKLSLAAIFIDLLISWNVTFELAKKAWTFVANNCKTLFSSTYVAQVNDNACIRAVAMLITCVMSVVGTMALPCQKLIDLVLKRTGDMGRATAGFRTILDTMSGVFDNVYDMIYEFITGAPPNDTALDKMLCEIRDWFREVDELVKINIYDNISVSYKDCRRIEQAHAIGLDFIKRMDQMKISPQHREPFNKYWTMLTKLYEKVIAYGARKAEPRTEPVLVRIFGKAGCGKSGLVFLLAQDLCAIEGMAENFMDELYFRNQVQEFWDGYCGQMVTVIDDFGQVRDSLGNVNKEFLEVIRCKNIAKWPLHMASLEQKSRTNFVSRAVILTSNELVYDTPSITCKEALSRRMDITVECRIKSEFRISSKDVKLDTDKVKSNMDTDIYEFVVYEDNKPTDIILTYDEFSRVCCDAYRKAYCESRGRLETLKERGKRMQAAYKAQVASSSFTLDRAICPALWLAARSGTHQDLDTRIINDKLLTRKQCDALIAMACECETYNDFMCDIYDYCVGNGIDLLQSVSSDYDYQSLSNYIYDNNLTLNKRITTRLRYVNEMYDRFKDTIQSYYDKIKKGPGLALLTMGGIFTGLMAMYTFKNYLFSPSEKMPKFRPLDETKLVPGYTPESRDEKRPSKIFRREGCCAESRDEKRPRKVMKSEFSFIPQYCQCTCKIGAIAKLAYKEFSNILVKQSSNTEYYCDGKSFCWICFGHDPEAWEAPILDVIKEYDLECKQHDKYEQTYDVFDFYQTNAPYYAQALIDVNAKELADGPVAGNMYKIATLTDEGWEDRVHGFFVEGRAFLTVKHLKDWLKDEIKIHNTFVPDGLIFRKEECQFIDLVNRDGELVDAMIIVLPDSVPMHRSIVKNFARREDINSFNTVPGRLVHLKALNVKSHGSVLSLGHYAIKRINAIDQEQYIMVDENKRQIPYLVRNGYEYAAETVKGDCGAPLIASANQVRGKILGIHVAGAANSSECSALATSITKGMLDVALKQVSTYRAQIKLDIDMTGECDMPPGNFIPLGKYKHILPSPSKTMYNESPLHEPMLKFKESTKRPALLKPKIIDGVLVNPLMKGLAKCGGVSPLIDNNLLDRCVIAVSSFLKRNRNATMRGPLTVEQAIRGIPGDPYIRSINRTSSPGIPWVFQKKTTLPGKQEWLGQSDEFTVDNPELMNRLKLRLEKAKAGERLETIWADTLKDELRLNAKVDAGKTRVFSAGPMDYVIFMRQYYLPFFSHMMYNRIDNFSAVGINPFDMDWHRLAVKLQSFGVHVIDGDFENFDGTLLATFLWAVCRVINHVEDDGNDRIREVIFADIVNSIHLHGNNVYAWTHSLTSGNPGTAIINSVYNILSMVYVFCKCTGKSAPDFFKNVFMIAYGDDNALCISESIIDQFNMQTIADEYVKIGMKYTDASKTGELRKFSSLEKIGFLKREFRFDKHLMKYVAPLQLDTIIEMTMWVTSSSDPHTLCGSNVDRAYHELALHGEPTFNRWSKILYELSVAYIHNPPVLGHFLDYLGKDFGY